MVNLVWVKALVDPGLYLKVPGLVIRLWGHDFEVQRDGSLCLEMHSDYVNSAVRARRVEVLREPPPGKAKISPQDIKIIETIPDGFTMDIGNYYGAGDLNTLIERVGELTNKAMIKFAIERFPGKKKLKGTMNKDDLIDKIRSYIDSAFVQFKNEED